MERERDVIGTLAFALIGMWIGAVIALYIVVEEIKDIKTRLAAIEKEVGNAK